MLRLPEPIGTNQGDDIYRQYKDAFLKSDQGIVKEHTIEYPPRIIESK